MSDKDGSGVMEKFSALGYAKTEEVDGEKVHVFTSLGIMMALHSFMNKIQELELRIAKLEQGEKP